PRFSSRTRLLQNKVGANVGGFSLCPRFDAAHCGTMKLSAATAIALLVPLLAPADWVMENKIDSPRGKIFATIKAKGDKFRVDVADGPQGAMSTILDTGAGEIVQLAHDRKEARKILSE